MLVIPTMTYSEKVLVMIGSKIIDWVIGMMTKGELVRATVTWRQAHFGAVMSRSLQLPYTTSKEDGEVGKEVTSTPSSNPAASRRFCLDDVQGLVHTAQKATIPPLWTVSIHGHTGIWDTTCGSICLPNQYEALNCLLLSFQLLPMENCTQGPLRVPICLRNLSAHPIEVPAKAIVGHIAPANKVPLLVLQMEASGGPTHDSQKGWMLEALNCKDLGECLEVEQEQARELLLKWEHLFAHSELDLGKTSLIKHWIKLTDLTPFKKHHWHIPPHMYDNVKAHLLEMLDIGAIRKSHSSWASAGLPGPEKGW